MEIQFFENAQFGQLRCMNINGEAWLMATDVARKLGYTNPQKAIRDHVDEEDKRTERIVHPSGGAQQTLLINESGLYALILSSKLPQAKEFKHWVTSVVLPQIRKTGGYIPMDDGRSTMYDGRSTMNDGRSAMNDGRSTMNDGRSTMDDADIMARALMIAQKTIELKNGQLEAQKPKVMFAEAVTAQDDSILIRDLAKLITQNGVAIGQGRLFYWLRLHGYLFQKETRPIQKWVEKGLFELNITLVQTHHGVKEHCTTKVTGKGQEYFVNGFLTGRFKNEE